jgi:hypothetical protein
VLGNPNHCPTIDECSQLIMKPETNAVINLLGVKLNDRPRFFLSLFARIQEVRAQTGRPHVLIVDEAHHVLPANWQPAASNMPERLDGVLLVSVSPSLVAAPILRAVDTVIVLGEKPQEMLDEFATANAVRGARAPAPELPPGTALLWNKNNASAPLVVKLEPGKTERRRHLRKYAEGELPVDRSFFFRGPENKLKLRAHNLVLFLDLADGVDDDTWTHHLRRNEYSQWMRDAIKDPELAEQIAAIEQQDNLDAERSRQEIRKLVEAKYTLPATKPAAAS